MNIKLYVWISLLALVLAYTQEGAVIVLKNEDLPTIKQTFPNILIKYYVSWFSFYHLGVNTAKNLHRSIKN